MNERLAAPGQTTSSLIDPPIRFGPRFAVAVPVLLAGFFAPAPTSPCADRGFARFWP